MSTAQLPLFNFDPSIVPDIDFCVKDASQIEAEVITNYEKTYETLTRTGMTLGRGDPRRLFLLCVVYQLVVQRSIVDSTGKENLLKYAHGADLENIGAMYGKRGLKIPATFATATLEFAVANTITTDCPIPEGTIARPAALRPGSRSGS
jgi:hypothetical protein